MEYFDAAEKICVGTDVNHKINFHQPITTDYSSLASASYAEFFLSITKCIVKIS